MSIRSIQRGFGFEAPLGSDAWFTPAWVFEALGLTFDLDPCAGSFEAPAASFCRSQLFEGGLDHPWAGSVWLNPPYSDIEAWVEQLLRHVEERQCTGITLTYCRMERPWAQEIIMNADAVLFLGENPADGRRRVHFIPGAGQKASSPGGPSMLCAFGREEEAALVRMSKAGHGALMRPIRVAP